MAQQTSAALLFRWSVDYINGQLAAIDLDNLDKDERRSVQELRRLTGETRLDIRDYEYADSRAEAQRHAREARQRLGLLRSAVLRLAEAGIFGAADVAQLTAQLDAVADRLQ